MSLIRFIFLLFLVIPLSQLLYGMSPEQEDSFLIFAIRHNEGQLVQEMLSIKADANSFKSFSHAESTPLKFAVYYEHSDIVRLLVNQGAVDSYSSLECAIGIYFDILKNQARTKMHHAFFTANQEKIIAELDVRLAEVKTIISFLAEHLHTRFDGIKQRAKKILLITYKDIIKQQEDDLADQQIQKWFIDSEAHAGHAAVPLIDLESKV
ncbi:MAG: hypothetical protein WC365_00035 [Candidatus Babeliales bacterium]